MAKLPERLSYPKDQAYLESTDYIEFKFYEYNPVFNTTAAGAGASALELYNASNSGLKQSSTVNSTIFMYMPEDISTGYQSEWGGKSFTNTAMAALRTAGQGAQGGGALQRAVTEIGQAGQRLPSLVAQQLVNAINGLPGGIGGDVGINDVLQGAGGVIINPNVELMFTGFQLRNFGFKFKMVPRNGTEAKMIRDIITAFKMASLPTLGKAPTMFSEVGKEIFKAPDAAGSSASGGNTASDNNSNYIGIPNLCHVRLKRGRDDHPYLPQFKVSAITSVDVNYTPDGSYATYTSGDKDAIGSPVATELSVSFTETKLVYANDIVSGGASY
jgi:hypothetical protein